MMGRKKRGNGWTRRKPKKREADRNGLNGPDAKRIREEKPSDKNGQGMVESTVSVASNGGKSTTAGPEFPAEGHDEAAGVDSEHHDESVHDGAAAGDSEHHDESVHDGAAAGDSEHHDENEQGKDVNEHEMNFVEGLDELQRFHGNEKNVHFFEYVMAMVLGARLDKAKKLEDFVKFIVGPSLRKQETEFNLSLELCDRKMPGVRVAQKVKRNNVLEVYYVKDEMIQFSVVRKQSSTPNEIIFLNWARDKIRRGDLGAIPLLLNNVEPQQLNGRRKNGEVQGSLHPETNFFIPDYGMTLDYYFKNSSRFVDTDVLGLSLLSTLSSISCVNTDLHSQNICVFRPDLVFQYIWTVRASSHMIEFSWTSNGALATIDWEYNTLFPRLSGSRSQSAFLSVPWETQIGNLELFGLSLSGRFSGLHGMAVILNHVFSRFNPTAFKARYCKLPEYDKTTSVSSVLEVFPNDTNAYSFDSTDKARWNQLMSSRGRTFKTQKFLTHSDIVCIHSLFQKFCSCVEKPFHEIPSDLGNVILMKDGKLVAAKSIEIGEIITYVPLTKCDTFDNPCIYFGQVNGFILKKAWPFCGFGGFAQWGNEANSNCSMKTISSFVALFATKRINKNDPIVCINNFIQRPRRTVVDDIKLIKQIVVDLLNFTSRTRAEDKSDDS